MKWAGHVEIGSFLNFGAKYQKKIAQPPINMIVSAPNIWNAKISKLDPVVLS